MIYSAHLTGSMARTSAPAQASCIENQTKYNETKIDYAQLDEISPVQ